MSLLRCIQVEGREGNGKPPWQIRETVSMQPHHSAVLTCHHGPSPGVSP